MAEQAETVRGYTRWSGRASAASRIGAIAWGEIQRQRRNTWLLVTAGAALAWGVASTIELFQLRSTDVTTHDPAGFWDMLDQLRWFVLAAAAVLGCGALLDDSRSGALELYLSRPVTRWDHLLGKALCVLGLCIGLYVGCIAAYGVGSYVFFHQHPPGWGAMLVSGLGYGVLWCILAAGASLAASCLSPNGRAASIIVVGAAVVLHIGATVLLPQLTEVHWLSIFSPFGAHTAIQPVFWHPTPPPATAFGPPPTVAASPFPAWWGLVEILGLSAAVWAVVMWKHPRLRGAADA